MIIPLDEEPV